MKKKSPDHDQLYRIADDQAGYFTTSQAEEVGFSRSLLAYHRKVGNIEKVAHGVYRLNRYPASRFEDLFVAWLRAGPQSVISHESALMVFELSDIMSAIVHVTIPRSASRRRKGIRLHTNKLESGDITRREGLPVTTVHRTIADVASSGLAEEQVLLAIRQALERGLANRNDLESMAHARGGRPARLIRKAFKQ